MADRYRSFPNQYGDNNLTSTGLAAVEFGFVASRVIIENLGAGPAYVSFDSTGPASTSDHRVSSGVTREIGSVGVGMSAMAWATSSTANILNVIALG